MTAHFVIATPGNVPLLGLPFILHRDGHEDRTGQFASEVRMDGRGDDVVDVVFDGDGHRITTVSARDMGIVADNDGGATYTLVDIARLPEPV